MGKLGRMLEKVKERAKAKGPVSTETVETREVLTGERGTLGPRDKQGLLESGAFGDVSENFDGPLRGFVGNLSSRRPLLAALESARSQLWDTAEPAEKKKKSPPKAPIIANAYTPGYIAQGIKGRDKRRH
jgi:hypothetical protein